MCVSVYSRAALKARTNNHISDENHSETTKKRARSFENDVWAHFLIKKNGDGTLSNFFLQNPARPH